MSKGPRKSMNLEALLKYNEQEMTWVYFLKRITERISTILCKTKNQIKSMNQYSIIIEGTLHSFPPPVL